MRLALNKLRRTMSPSLYVAFISLMMASLFNYPLYTYTANNLDAFSMHGMATFVSLFLAIFSLTALVLSCLLYLSERLCKLFISLIFISNSIALYFICTFQVLLDKSMMGNIFNTDFDEATSYLGTSLFYYLIGLGIIPAYVFIKPRINASGRGKPLLMSVLALIISFAWLFCFSSNWLWFDEHSKPLGGKVLPWSYIVNSIRYQRDSVRKEQKPELLPNGTIKIADKQLLILVIGETARAHNFSQYGYGRETTPRLSQLPVIAMPNSRACNTYTTGSVRCILSHTDSSSEFSTFYEPLPSYLSRHGIDVIWRSNNWGEPNLVVNTYEKATDLMADCKRDNCQLDEVLLTSLKERISQSTSDKIFVVLHTKGSHGPDYFNRYPDALGRYAPVCKSVNLNECSYDSLINAYDNSLLYTDYFLAETIDLLKSFRMPSAMIYISDHGESLGEHGLYLHGTPNSLAPTDQTDIPFFVWMSDEFLHQKMLKPELKTPQKSHSQSNVFHSVLGAFNLDSEIYLQNLDIFNEFRQLN